MANQRVDDMEFMSDLRAAVMTGPRLSAQILLLAIVAFFVLAFIWASVATLDEVTSGQGQIIPSSQIQVVQNLEGGILSKIHVREGEVVKQGQILLTIDDTLVASKFREDKVLVEALQARIVRLEAEQSGEDPKFPDQLLADRPSMVASELAVLHARRNELDSAIEVFKRQAEQKSQEIAELNARIHQFEGSLALGREELGILRPLVEQGVSARIELIRLQRTVNDLSGELETTRQGVPRARSALAEVSRRIDERRAAYQSEVARDLAIARAEIASNREGLTSSEDRVRRTEVRSPVDGTVKQIMLSTVGGVVQPGQDLVEVVPLEDALLVEARIRPADIAFIHPGQTAKVKITAYDFAVFGGLDATLEQISADTITDDDGESFYKIIVRTEDSFLTDREGNTLPIISGMVAEVDILSGKKTVLEYLLKPILRAKGRALREH